MLIIKSASALTSYCRQQQAEGRRIGFVPTMGALHPGHLSLLREATAGNEIIVCSIFVNPTQFNNADDFKKYPVTIEEDIHLLITAGCSVLFLPAVEEIYPPGYVAPHYELGTLETVLEGEYRPGHFQGVCQVVDRLLTLVAPDQVYFGEKDFQQCLVIRRLLAITGREQRIQMEVAPTLREEDGLAMSSRNQRLTPHQRQQAVLISSLLTDIQQKIGSTSITALEKEGANTLAAAGFTVDYVAIRNTENLLPPTHADQPLVALIAAALGSVRLIDNRRL